MAADTPIITNVAGTGSDALHVLNADMHSVTIHANGGDVQLRFAASGDYYTISAGTKDCFSMRSLRGSTLYLKHAVGVTAEVLETLGFGS